jgi:hypothetical protein
MIALTREAVLIQADKIGMLGEVTFADWHRDVTGQVTGTVAPSLTQIRGGVVRTEKIFNFAGTSWIDLDASGTTDFIRSSAGVAIKANGNFTFGNTGASKALVWDGANLTIQNSSLLGSTTVATVVANANFGATRSVGDITADVLSNSATSITMNSSQLFKSTGGVAGVFIGSGGIFGKNALGANTFAISGTTGAASFAGDVETGGKGFFNGSASLSGSPAASVVANRNNVAPVGVVAFSNNGFGAAMWGFGAGCPGVIGQATAGQPGVLGSNTASSGPGVQGITGTSGGIGVHGRSTHGSAAGVVAENTGGGAAISILGTMLINNSAQVSNLNASFVRGFGTELVRYLGDGGVPGVVTVNGSILINTVGGAGTVKVPTIA